MAIRGREDWRIGQHRQIDASLCSARLASLGSTHPLGLGHFNTAPPPVPFSVLALALLVDLANLLPIRHLDLDGLGDVATAADDDGSHGRADGFGSLGDGRGLWFHYDCRWRWCGLRSGWFRGDDFGRSGLGRCFLDNGSGGGLDGSSGGRLATLSELPLFEVVDDGRRVGSSDGQTNREERGGDNGQQERAVRWTC